MRSYRIATLSVTGLFAAAVFTNHSTAAPANHLPTERQVLNFIADTIGWYRHLPSAQEIGTAQADLLFLDDNESITAEIVRHSLEFGKAVAAIASTKNASGPLSIPGAAAANSDFEDLVTIKTKLDANTQQAVSQLNSLTQASLTARGAERKKLAAQMAETRKRIQVLGIMVANYQTMFGFVTNASADADRATNLAAVIENLERGVPELSAAAHPSTSNIPLDPSRAPSSLIGMISRVSALAREERVIDGAIERTDALRQSLQSMEVPFREYFRSQFSTLSWDATSLGVLQRQQSRLTGLVAEEMTASPAIGALLKQKTLLKLYRTHLTEWRSEVHLAYRAAWKTLLVRVSLLCAVTAILFGIHVLVRRLTYRQVHDFNTRHMFLVGQRVLLWLLIVALVLFAFAFDLSSIATFLGLLSAGLAVGFRDAFLAIGGYLVIVRKCHVRVGDRVEISGVTGDVTSLGLLQFELSEIDPATDQRTGRVVFFSNSLVFVSPATPFFRQLSAPR